MIRFKRAETQNELEQILALQRENLPPSLTSEERKKEGFVTVEHSLELLTKMNDVCPHIIATLENSVVGYALCMHPQFGEDIEVLRPMFAQIYSLKPGNPFIVMGQVCVAKDFRGKGVFRKLYETMLHAIQPEFKQIITEVDLKNIRSVSAHLSIGFVELERYRSGGHDWVILSLSE